MELPPALCQSGQKVSLVPESIGWRCIVQWLTKWFFFPGYYLYYIIGALLLLNSVFIVMTLYNFYLIKKSTRAIQGSRSKKQTQSYAWKFFCYSVNKYFLSKEYWNFFQIQTIQQAFCIDGNYLGKFLFKMFRIETVLAKWHHIFLRFLKFSHGRQKMTTIPLHGTTWLQISWIFHKLWEFLSSLSVKSKLWHNWDKNYRVKADSCIQILLFVCLSLL